jgi:hypothetical protein
MLLAATMCVTAHAQQPVNLAAPPNSTSRDFITEHKIARKLSLVGVGNFGEVTPTLYRGAQPSRDGFADLMKTGIEEPVALDEGECADERNLVTKLGMQYVRIPWRCGHSDNHTIARFLACFVKIRISTSLSIATTALIAPA